MSYIILEATRVILLTRVVYIYVAIFLGLASFLKCSNQKHQMNTRQQRWWQNLSK